jgi:hypothetical protein
MLNCAWFARARLALGAIQESGRGYSREKRQQKAEAAGGWAGFDINKCLKCGRGRICVASASVRRRTVVSEWISWTLPSCRSGGAAKSAPISNQ